MKRWWPVLLCLWLVACSDKKPDLSGEKPVKTADFLAVFPPLVGSFSAADSNLARLGDTTTIGYRALQQFFPDSALTDMVGKDNRQKIHAVGKIEKDNETYLLLKFTNRKKISQLAVFVLDKKHKFLAAKKLLDADRSDGYLHSVTINREPTFFIGREKKGKEENTTLYSRAGWVYNDAGLFMVVVNDSNEGLNKAAPVVNPLDTLPRKNKFSGDYVRDKRNFISVRDNSKPNTYLFFVHFEKDGGCNGELKGEMTMKSNNSARYTAKGDPCVIDFNFEGNEITIKETGTCGNRRGMKCLFDDSFTRKKELRKKK
ncbi:hypothetical protein [Sediminibacterium soli]|uniref:hypothetical protein n=1 Tax=Sediminibacterium soli TaxID=2698829 RepID=UPI001379C54F|nr:hypothetical protein [Sediminibacterium soli]NCI46082.1 hypothetical protein [Sediminibacterium soli]